ncbi:phosphotransferase [Catellatospora bangladeshensis]|uniref:Aminoglycoside phosphotransferase domain-containing protein n=1 Tax=Catellatospora bangladeshensis TaxID=310355 RepID=A0A8J3J5U8_9ACTN|nr:phosphotransferase [Catellatospora bangladeshensis]GIF78677.1 hypothetical protein Cba03nite_00260 [Catellatospora bangladeshensis]
MSGAEWAAEHEVGAAQAAELIGARFPRLRGLTVTPFATGWDNTVHLVGGEWVFRFPRRAIALKLLAHETAVLPRLAGRLPLPVPCPELIGEPACGYPWPYWGARLLPGVGLADSGLPDEARVAAAAGLGAFLRALHDPALAAAVAVRRPDTPTGVPGTTPGTGIGPDTSTTPGTGTDIGTMPGTSTSTMPGTGTPAPVPDLGGPAAGAGAAASDGGADEPRAVLPVDPMGRGNPSVRAPLARERLDRVAAQGIWQPDPAVYALLDGAVRLGPPDGAPVLVHGDLHQRHLLLDATGRAAGVIDWGDVCLGDPALDLSLAFSGFTGPARAALLDAYGPVPPEREARARVLAVFLSVTLAEYAHGEHRTALLRESLAGISRAAR